MINHFDLPDWYLVIQILDATIIQDGPWTLDHCKRLVNEAVIEFWNMAGGRAYLLWNESEMIRRDLIVISCENTRMIR